MKEIPVNEDMLLPRIAAGIPVFKPDLHPFILPIYSRDSGKSAIRPVGTRKTMNAGIDLDVWKTRFSELNDCRIRWNRNTVVTQGGIVQ
ncbi:hypothetical protein SDC9_201167 [bioreactor metagenome]|uniref:Uncharacterized protein n=1 Tax=bioreactor metagenome TaxID=1076179 RepID=A0A645J230_9ZZZZ